MSKPVYVLSWSTGYPEDNGDEVFGVYWSLDSAFREIASRCKGNSIATPYGGPGQRSWGFVLRPRDPPPGRCSYANGTSWWLVEELEVQP